MGIINFDKYYANEKCYWGLKPSKLVEEILKYKKSGSVLDLGCGEGRNALFLAKKGFDVTGIDISKEGIKKLERIAKEYNVKIKSFVQEISNFPCINYDIIMSIVTLHFFEKDEIGRLVEKIKNYTSENGLNIISVFTEKNPYKKFPYLFKQDELRNLYENWEILHYREFITPLKKRKNRLFRRSIAELIAKKIK